MSRLTGLSTFLQRLSVRGQLALAFGVILTMLLGLGGTAVVSLNNVNAAASKLALENLPGVRLTSSMRTSLLEYRDLEIKHTNAPDESYHAEYEDKLKETGKAIDDALSTYQKRVMTDAEREHFADFGKAWTSARTITAKLIQLGRSGKQVDAQDVSEGAAAVASMEAIAAIDKLTAYQFESAAISETEAQATHHLALSVVLGIVATAVVIGLALTFVITGSLLRQLGGEPRDAAQVAWAVAHGDLNTPIRLRAGDQTSVMAQLAEMQQRLSEVVASVRHGSQHVASASEDIAQGSSALSERTDQQASSLQQTASSMEELGSTVTRNAENARQANELATLASTVAVRGGEAVNAVVSTMHGINESSRRISDIIGTIDSIAFQTNILALNAAVEAARAGEQGRGFAVVASEVRSLAQRSADAAKEIKTLIRGSVERVEQGSAEVDRAGDTMKEVVESIQRVNQIVGEISAASLQQSAGVDQVGAAVAEMDRATQQNAAMVGESSAAAGRLREEAQALVQVVAQFKLQAA